LAIKALAGMQAVLNSSTILVIHHTGKFSPDMGSPPSSLKSLITVPDCGMSHVSDEECRQHLMKIVPENEKEAIRGEKFGEIRDRYVFILVSPSLCHLLETVLTLRRFRNFEDSIKEDVRILRESTWIKKDTRIVGLMYDTHTGGFKEIDDYEPENWPGAADGKKTDAQFAADYAALLEAR
jgi:carbonic anhydrase